MECAPCKIRLWEFPSATECIANWESLPVMFEFLSKDAAEDLVAAYRKKYPHMASFWQDSPQSGDATPTSRTGSINGNSANHD